MIPFLFLLLTYMYFMDPAAILYVFLDVRVFTHGLSLVPLSFFQYLRMELQAVNGQNLSQRKRTPFEKPSAHQYSTVACA